MSSYGFVIEIWLLISRNHSRCYRILKWALNSFCFFDKFKLMISVVLSVSCGRDYLQGFAVENMKTWKAHWDRQLYKALEHQYQMGLEALNENLPEIKIELTFVWVLWINYLDEAISAAAFYWLLTLNYWSILFLSYCLWWRNCGALDVHLRWHVQLLDIIIIIIVIIIAIVIIIFTFI